MLQRLIGKILLGLICLLPVGVFAQGGRMSPAEEAWLRQIYMGKTSTWDYAYINSSHWTNFYHTNSNLFRDLFAQGVTNVIPILTTNFDAVVTGHTAYISFDVSSSTAGTWASNNLVTLMDDYYYVSPSVAWVTSKSGTYEKGSSFDNVILDFTVNKTCTNRYYSGGYSATLGPGTSYSYTDAVTISANGSYTVRVWDSRTNSATATQTFTFTNRRYYGVCATALETISDAELRALTVGWQSKGASGTVAPSDQYIYVAYPASLGACTSFTLGGFATSEWPNTTRDVVNSSGYSESFIIYRSNNKLTSASISYDIH